MIAPDTQPSDTGPDFARVRAAAEVMKGFVAHFEAGRYSGDDAVTLLKFFTEMERTAVAAKTAQAKGRREDVRAYRADALVALITGTNLIGPQATTNATTSDESVESDTPVRTKDPKATVNVVVDLDTLRQGNVGPGGRCEIPGVGPVSVEYVRERLGDSLVKVFVTSATDIHTVWSPGRRLPRDLRAALVLRDPRCAVPGCDSRLGLECDHWVTDFAQGGLTALDNLARVCKRHHRQRTHEGFELTRGPNGWEWIPPHTPFVPTRPRRRKKAKTKAPPPTGTSPSLFDPEE